MRAFLFLLFTALLGFAAVSCGKGDSKSPTEPQVGIEAYIFTEFWGRQPDEFNALYLPIAMEYNVVTESPYYAEGRVKCTDLEWLEFTSEYWSRFLGRYFTVDIPDSLKRKGYRYFSFSELMFKADTLTGYWYKEHLFIDTFAVPFVAVKGMYYE